MEIDLRNFYTEIDVRRNEHFLFLIFSTGFSITPHGEGILISKIKLV